MHQLLADYLECMERLYNDIKQALDGLPEQALDWSPAPDVNSIAVLVAHAAGSGRMYIGEKAGGTLMSRDRDAEFRTHGRSAAELVALLDENLNLARTVFANLTLEELERTAGTTRSGTGYSVAWALLHQLEHLAQHVGHIQITRQWWEQQRAKG